MQLACQDLKQWQAQSLTRTREIQSDQLICFNSSDYLNLSRHPVLIETIKKSIDQHGVNSRGSAFVNGYTQAHQEFEAAFAAFTGFEAGVFLSSGYLANLAILQSLTTADDIIVYDQLCHASAIDSLKLSQAKSTRYRHRNIEHLQQLLQPRAYIMTNSVFSCDGQLANLSALAKVAEAHQAQLIIDDAHGLAILGNKGSGAIDHFKLKRDTIAIVNYPLSKGFGNFGAMLCGPKQTIERIIQFARSYRYTTAIPPYFAETGIKTIELLKAETWRQQKLHELIDYFNQKTKNLLKQQSQTAIHAIPVTTPQEALSLKTHLASKGIAVGCLRPPSVHKNNCMLRITLNISHTLAQIDQLISHIQKYYATHN